MRIIAGILVYALILLIAVAMIVQVQINNRKENKKNRK